LNLPDRLCPRCERAACICALLPPEPVVSETELLILQHPDESRQAKGTVPLLRLGLQRCEVRVGEVFEPPSPDRRNLLLYPGEASETGTDEDDSRPLRLIVLDGTWRQSRQLMFANPWLAALPRLALADAPPSCYAALRRAHRPGQLSSLEAALLALESLEGARFEPLWQSFERFIAQQTARRPGRL
jgi:DTW domain-containing protein YfiP